MHARSSHIVLLAAGDGAVLALDRPHVHALRDDLVHPVAWVARAGADTAAAQFAGALLWLAAAWFGIALTVAAAACLPGATGRTARRLCVTIMPATLARILLGLVGAGMVLAPAATAGARPVSAAVLSAPATPSVPDIAAPTLPHLPPTALPLLSPTAAPHLVPPALRHLPQAATPEPQPIAVTNVLGQVDAPVWPMDPAQSGHRSARPPHTTTGAVSRVHVVRAGDTLWTITGYALGPAATPHQIASEWPRLYAVNRSTLDADPNLIHPGQRLRLPPEWPNTAPPQSSERNEVPR